MKLHLTLLACLLNLLFVIKASAAPLIRPNDRLAICGNAMTAELGYSLYIEDYLLMCQRVEGLDVSQFGWSGETAEAFLARLDIDLPPFRPTIVTTCFGVDDGDQKATDDDTANRFRQVQTDLVAALKKRGVRIVVLGSPKCVDSFHYHRDPAQAAVRNKMLRARADIIKNVAAAEGVIYADVFNATMAAMVKAKARNGERYVFDSEDGHQSSDGCKLAMAYAFLKALGCDGNIGTITMDYKTQTVKCDPGQRIVSDKDRAVIVESTRYPFIFFDPRTRSAAENSLAPVVVAGELLRPGQGCRNEICALREVEHAKRLVRRTGPAHESRDLGGRSPTCDCDCPTTDLSETALLEPDPAR